MEYIGITRAWTLNNPNIWAMPEVYEKPLWWQERGLMFTASGYGHKIPSRYMVKLNGRMRRVYTSCHSNCATNYVDSKDGWIIVELSEVE